MNIFKIRFKYKSRLDILWSKGFSTSLESSHSASSKLEWPTNKIRDTFIDYFCLDNKHKFIKSSSVLPRKGSGTYFTNAGMNQFKSIILGELQASEIIDSEQYVGVANSQKCIRIGGKHSDLDEIGKDTYHHTFFEMLGNWSFGSYKNEKACELALDLLVNVYKLNINGLYFTYFGGDKNLGLEADLHTKNTWHRLGVPERQILPFGLKENFWEMDVVGPCGPCTEIHYDRLINSLNNSTEIHKARDLVNMGTERVIELWNIVSMNYNRINQKTFTHLPHQVIDTGMGLERLSAVLNNLSSNYDTDLFQPLFDHIYSYGKLKNVAHYKDCKLDSHISSQYRTLSDHMRSIVISISDGLIPSRNGLGGFLKFLILKCLKISRHTFKVDDEVRFLNEMVSIVVQTLKPAYPELIERENYVQEVIRDTFLKQKEKQANSKETTERYLKKLGNPTNLTGDQIWRLFKGNESGHEIPLEFITNFAQERNISLDMNSFDRIFIADNEKALKNMKNTREENTLFIELATKLKDVPKTDDSFKYSFELDDKNSKVKIRKPLKANILSLSVKKANNNYAFENKFENKDECILVLDKTSFYPESGGQASDRGYLKDESSNLLIRIDKVLNVMGYSFHIGQVESCGDSEQINNRQVECLIDEQYRYETTLNHTGIHLLNHSIRKCFQDEKSIMQTHSSAKNDSFRFEFKFYKTFTKPSLSDLKQIETLCNDLIRKELPIYTEEDVYLEKETEIRKNELLNYPVRKLNDILYPKRVRIVSIGKEWKEFSSQTHADSNSTDFSAELCCGTHATNTSQLRNVVLSHFNVVGDSSYEIQCFTASQADEAKRNDKLVLDYLNEMKNLSETSTNESTFDKLNKLNEISDRSIKIESIFKTQPVSYLVLQETKAQSVKYRPSKSVLQNTLKKYIQEQLEKNKQEKQLSRLKKIKVRTSLQPDMIVNTLKKMDNLVGDQVLLIHNEYRSHLIVYTASDSMKNYLDKIQVELQKFTHENSLLETNKNYRVLKCSVLEDAFLNEIFN